MLPRILLEILTNLGFQKALLDGLLVLMLRMGLMVGLSETQQEEEQESAEMWTIEFRKRRKLL